MRAGRSHTSLIPAWSRPGTAWAGGRSAAGSSMRTTSPWSRTRRSVTVIPASASSTRTAVSARSTRATQTSASWLRCSARLVPVQAVTDSPAGRSTWTRADLMKYLGRAAKDGHGTGRGHSPLEDLADRALRSEFEPVICLEAPEAVQVPRSLLRADGRSIYQRHGGVRYATRAQLAMEERLLARAGAEAAPRLTRAGASRALGTELARLQDTLAGRAQDSRSSSRTCAADCRSVRGCAVGADRRQARLGDQRAGRVGQDAGDDRSPPGLGRRTGARPDRR